jgi:hypothetical protein
MSAKMIASLMPDDPELLAAYGRVTVAHAQLDHFLQMTVKTVAEVEVREALLATRRQGAGELRVRIRTLAKRRLGEGEALVRLDAILREAEIATRDRNSYVHDPLAVDEEGVWVATGDDANLKVPPTVQQLKELATRITDVGRRLNYARLNGWLREALDKKPKNTI